MTRSAAIRAGFCNLVPWIALAALWAVFIWSQHGGLYAASDDSYIYLGYVKRALTPPHELFSYNPGEHSAGITGMAYYYWLLAVCGLVRAIAFAASIESVLLVGAFLANAALLTFGAHLYLRCWRRLTDGGDRMGAIALSISFLLFCAQPKWLWAVFAGLEGPLAACLALLLVERLLYRAPVWQVAVVSALLVTTRPETMLVMWWPPLFAALAELRRGASRRSLLLRLGGAYAIAAVCLAALVLPCYVLTGRVFPSSLGTRVHLAGLLEPDGLARYFGALFASRDYWLSEWWVLAGALFVAGVALGWRTGRWATACLSGHLLAFLALRALAGLAPFSVEDRYVSYLWPLYALGVAACAGAALRGVSARPTFGLSRFGGILVSLVVYAVTAALPVRDFLARASWHVGAMNAIVVEPSRWMRAHLPATARVCMEPAGALRVFTDFYLIDAIGLTTTHADTHAGNYLDFLHDHRVGWVFDRPSHVGKLLLERQAARDIRGFAPRLPWGDVHLYEVDLSAAIEIVSLSAQPSVPGRSRGVFDNSAAASWDPLRGGSSGFASGRAPALISAEFERPALVDGLTLALSGPGARGRNASAEYRFEGRRDGAWVGLAAKPQRAEPLGPNRALSTFSLEQPIELQGIRVVREPAIGSRAPVIDELTLHHAGRPWVWLWSARPPGSR